MAARKEEEEREEAREDGENGEEQDGEGERRWKMVVVEEACVPNDVCTPRHVNDISGG